MDYSWKDSIASHLENFSGMTFAERVAFFEHHRFNIPMTTIFELADTHGVESIEFNDTMLKLLFENMGDYDDIQPYCVDSIEKLKDDERDFLTKTLNLIKEEIVHVKENRSSIPENN